MAIEKTIEIVPEAGVEASYLRILDPLRMAVGIEVYRDKAKRKAGGRPAATITRRLELTEAERSTVMGVLYAALKRLNEFDGAKDIDPDKE